MIAPNILLTNPITAKSNVLEHYTKAETDATHGHNCGGGGSALTVLPTLDHCGGARQASNRNHRKEGSMSHEIVNPGWRPGHETFVMPNACSLYRHR